MTGEVPAIELKNVTFSYNGWAVLNDVTLSVTRGEFASIVGPNGGGKSTLMKLMVGLLVPDRGSIRLFGLPPQEARPRIGYMPQRIEVDPGFPVSVLDVVLMGRLGRHLFGLYGRGDRRAALAALEDVGMRDFARKPFSDLSGGQRQRVLIARALACEPELLLLDEPTSNLDLEVERNLYRLLSNLNKRLTIVIISHDLEFVSKYVNSVICVRHHVAVHPTSEISADLIERAFAGDFRMVRHDSCEESGECRSS